MLRKLRNFMSTNQPVQAEPEVTIETMPLQKPVIDATMEEPLQETFIEELPEDTIIDNTESIVDESIPINEDIMDTDQENPEELIEETSDEDELAYIYHSSEVVGYFSREQQVANYQLLYNIIGDTSVLDFGCGRGDFNVFYSQYLGRPMDQIDYTGIDLNNILIDAGKELYPNIDLRHMDWTNIPEDLRKDWCISAGSLNLRYDQNITITDWEYFVNSVNTMYNHANVAVAILLNSSLAYDDEGLLTWNPGDVLNWAQSTYGNVVIDHSYIDSAFTLIIYK